MTIILFSYDLNKERHKKGDYEELYKIRDKFDYVKLSESSYALNTASTPEAIYALAKPHLDPNDTLYIMRLAKPLAGQGNPHVNQWLEAFVPSL